MAGGIMTKTEHSLARIEAALAATRWDASLCAEIRAAYHRAVSHGVFEALSTPERLVRFLEKHVWAVWDFMSLTKSVQEVLAPVSRPWQPAPHAGLARLINEIVLEEESGFVVDGRSASHFEFYLHAMRAAGADTQQIDGFAAALRDGIAWQDCLDRFAPPPAARFVRITLEMAEATPAERIAAFALGREQLIPEMFPVLSGHLAVATHGRDFGPFRHYLDRHTEIDGEEHGPATQQMLEIWAADDPAAGRAALRAIQARVDLWDSILSSVSDLPGADGL
ncbi:MAG: hypothetical protein CMJ94_06140 [Planctomycetes bacterium]|nr:hypothetical protein [Planctomycetota bacterium]